MKMIRAIIRPEKENDVVKALELVGISAYTKLDVLGRGKQKGIQIGSAVYDELAKVMLMIVIEDQVSDEATEAIAAAGRTGQFGDGKIFISPVEAAITVRTGKPSL
ncbi:nitrogen fixation protein NifD [candidate division WOR-1 bacterium RIFCSPLOWO2_02_FULL_46_20]|uniref:Nitrogen fixation protein NifD n=2 Tax=Saganbacteria TaxID=1703751 RepID=A0A1F4R8E4_UNCSA|nr:MAG: nitrogen fixation protein NifD [candidate division WOR-1 bacterium RIFCSPLOWO2_02_FULL_46_20]OGC10126.1 MAG: nitrogen fixation protein NifD [candidate division WOR-1 bacterium RIFCSPLOWO2_12_FULL_45_9]